MLTYTVGWYFQGDEGGPKLLGTFDKYDDAFDCYIDKVKETFHEIRMVPTNLKIEYIQDGEFVGTERLITTDK